MVAPSNSELTADQQQFNQLAAILAMGVRRYHQRLKRSESLLEKEVPEISPDGAAHRILSYGVFQYFGTTFGPLYF